ncbi:AAA family ATPase [Rhodobacter capsulatus]|uniref:AAA family ATPase n=1 Tax=Rhodobacter capsulatus TaxID=1061 RepID=UPI0003D2FAD7|nr:AAA family ATPase [Rhodobacter capsulatus]ETD02071.1 GTPase [Rhodobacter capsulatus DE442]ETD77745.1 GTPase [Rhodobacter capsulatus R121]ETE54103.1 GTPase [Rhodobacter capsulatus Y262]MDS0926695.1 AAA family ATPase [Rhodobacter capsulatus]
MTDTRRLVFYDAEGALYFPVRDGGTGKSIFKIKPKGASNRAEDAIHLEDWLDVARAMLIDGLAARCRALSGGPINYLRFGAQKLVRYELDPELAEALGIAPTGVAGEETSEVSRAAIEAAMDAFDAWRQTGAQDEIFGAFGEPRDYWVRSTRDRENRVYPTKPLVGYLRGKTDLSGGWGQRNDAASFLHNAGFIIVDAEDRPVPPPERYDHLIRDAERVRLCARNYHIEPGREQGAAEVSIRSGDLAREMGLENAFPTICDALGGAKFQTLCALPPPRFTTPNPSSTTTFTYALAADGITPTMTAPDQAPVPPTNLILYGPPGTGKTYATAWEAVKLCLGAAADPLRDDRKALMAEYKRLCEEGRIEFTTFHQSMSYEDFVEGLRPVTDEGGSGFRLTPRDGIFKEISRRASTRPDDDFDLPEIDRSRPIFKLNMIGKGWRPGYDVSIATGRIYWLFGGKLDWSDPRFEDKEALAARWRETYPEATLNHASIGGTHYFRYGAKIGDYVALTHGLDRVFAFGRITGDYEYRPDLARPEVEDSPNSRTVDWLWSDPVGVERAAFYSGAFNPAHPLCVLNDSFDHDAFEAAIFGTKGIAEPHVLIIDEINRANISKVFGELITLLEADKRLGAANEIRLRLPYSGRNFGVPANLHIIGTMNTADRSIALLDTALRRRFTFRELMPDASVLPVDCGGVNLQKLLATLNARIEYFFDREHQIGHAYFTACTTRDDVAEVMRFKIIPLLAEYFYEDWGKVAAVLGDGSGRPERFLRAVPLEPPFGLGEEDIDDKKVSWQILETFDFADCAA